MSFQRYPRKGFCEARPYIVGEDLTGISVSEGDMPPQEGGMIARNPNDHTDMWYINPTYFAENFDPPTL